MVIGSHNSRHQAFLLLCVTITSVMIFKQMFGLSTDAFWNCIYHFMHMNLKNETKIAELMITEFNVLFVRGCGNRTRASGFK